MQGCAFKKDLWVIHNYKSVFAYSNKLLQNADFTVYRFSMHLRVIIQALEEVSVNIKCYYNNINNEKTEEIKTVKEWFQCPIQPKHD